MKFTEQIRKLKEGKVQLIYLFHGEDDFLTDQLVEALLPRVVDRSTRDFNYSVFYGGENSVSDFLQVAGEFPMMTEQRVVLVYDLHKFSFSEKDKEALTKYLQKPPDSTCLIMTMEKLDKRQKFHQALLEHSHVIEANVRDADVEDWLRDHLAQKKLVFSDPAVQTLIALIGNSLRELAYGVEKVVTFRPNRSPIEATDVKEVVGLTRTYEVFEFTKAAGMRDYSTALKMTKALLEQGEYPGKLILLLSQHFQKLAKAKDLMAEKAPYAAYFADFRTVFPKYIDEYKQQSQKYSLDEIHENLILILEADHQLKTSVLTPGIILESLVYQMLRPRKTNSKVISVVSRT